MISRRHLIESGFTAGIGLVLAGCGADPKDAKIATLEAQVGRLSATATPTSEAQALATENAQLKAQLALKTPEATKVVLPSPTFVPATKARTIEATKVRETPASCVDGELVFVLKTPEGQVFQRTPVGEAARADIVEVGRLGGNGFGGWDRFILVVPRLGPVWEVNVLDTSTVAERGFCGDNAAVAKWAVEQHVPSFRQASRDPNGKQPGIDEIAVYRLDFEKREMIVEKPANSPVAPKPETVLGWFDVSFHQGQNKSAVPMHVVTK